MANNPYLERLHQKLEPLRQAILEHPIYPAVRELQQLRIFMQHHVFAVWDFMSLLKCLQRELCCVAPPWIPPSDGVASRVINAIVLEEESDVDPSGGFTSHFSLYHRAMTRCGANTNEIDRFLEQVKSGIAVHTALRNTVASKAVRDFVCNTFHVIQSGDLPVIAASFTFGREELLPNVFFQIIRELSQDPQHQLGDLQYYLKRHVELDGDEHGLLAQELMVTLCADDERKWRRAESAAISALQARISLWDAAFQVMSPASRKTPHPGELQADRRT